MHNSNAIKNNSDLCNYNDCCPGCAPCVNNSLSAFVTSLCVQVSGEYAMLHHASAAGALVLKTAVFESWEGFRRAGMGLFFY